MRSLVSAILCVCLWLPSSALAGSRVEREGDAILRDPGLFEGAFADRVDVDAFRQVETKVGMPVVATRRPTLDAIRDAYGEPDFVRVEKIAVVPASFDPSAWDRGADLPDWPWRETQVFYYGTVGFGVSPTSRDGEVAWITNRALRDFPGRPRPIEPAAEPAPATKAAVQYDGNWTASTSSSRLSLTVVNNAVTDAGVSNLSFLNCSDGGSLFSVYRTPLAINGDKTEFSVSGVTSRNIWILSFEGSFDSATRVTGDSTILVLGACGFIIGFGSFDVSRQSDFVLHATPSYKRIFSSQSARFEIEATPLGGFNQSVPVTIQAPSVAGVTVSPTSGTIQPGGRLIVDVTTTATTPTAGVGLLITGTVGGSSHVTLAGAQVRFFELTITPSRAAIAPGGTATFTVRSESIAVTEPAALAADSDLPVSFANQMLRPGEQTTFTVTAPAGTEEDPYSISIEGTAAGRTERASATVSVSSSDFTFALDPSEITAARKSKRTVTASIGRVGSFSGPVTVTGFNGSAIDVKVKPTSTDITGSTATFTIKVKKTAKPGPYLLTFRAKGGSDLTRAASLILNIQ